jgi:hypothetical protein
MKLAQLTQEEKTTYVGLLTIEQKDSLVGQWYAPNSYFNPIQDINDNWVISVEEMEQCVNPNFIWVQDLDLISYEPRLVPNAFEI